MRIRQAHPLIQKINTFLYSPAYFVLIGGLTLLSNTIGAELFVYTCFIIIAVYICLLGKDLLPLLPMFPCGYISPSLNNNPGLNNQSVFSLAGGGLYLLVLIAILLVCLVYRLIVDPNFGGKKFFAHKRGLVSGMLVLGCGYILAGLGSGQWEKIGMQNLIFALLQFLAITAIYFLLSGSVLWDEAPKAYLAWTGMCVGFVLLGELAYIYLTSGVVVNGVIVREKIFTGWGHYNNMGSLLGMMIPFPFFLTGKGRKVPLFYFTALAFFGGLIFTCSRGSILCGTVIFVASYILSLIHSHNARSYIGIHILIASLGVIAIIVLFDKLVNLFSAFLAAGFDPYDRDIIYVEGLKQFFRFPVFGGSFYPVDYPLFSWATSEEFVSFFPPRWHNTIIQLLASCGIIGTIAYVFHRIQTVQLFFRRPARRNLFTALSIICLLMTSMLDNHMFNIGPVLFYSAALAFVENKRK